MKNLKFQIIAFLTLFILVGCSENNQKTLFSKVDSNTSGLHFNNQLFENDSINILDSEFVYNGAGVALKIFFSLVTKLTINYISMKEN
mgnify:CR=1 FL=1